MANSAVQPARNDQRIVDRDIVFYRDSLESEQESLRRCVPSREPYFRARIEAARKVVDSLHDYRRAIDAE
jgi:hypothetical protein